MLPFTLLFSLLHCGCEGARDAERGLALWPSHRGPLPLQVLYLHLPVELSAGCTGVGVPPPAAGTLGMEGLNAAGHEAPAEQGWLLASVAAEAGLHAPHCRAGG